MSKAVMTIILALSLSGCAFQAAPIQGALGNANTERTEQVKKTSGGEISVPSAGFLNGVFDTAAKFIPGNSGTVASVNGSDVEVEE